jgi:hypothetical protein
VVRDERARRRAGRQRRKHRRFDFDVAPVVEIAADLADDLRAPLEDLARSQFAGRPFLRRAAGDQVDVALAVAQLLVGHAVIFVGHRQQRLGQKLKPDYVDRKLAGLRDEQKTLDAEPIAEVQLLI